MFIKLNEEKIDSCLYSAQSSSCRFACDLRSDVNEISTNWIDFYFYSFMKDFVIIFASLFRLGHYSNKIVQIVRLKLSIYLILVKKKYGLL